MNYKIKSQSCFITGTDTNAGKTWATVELIKSLKQDGKIVLGMKPVASGCEIHEGILKNADALALQQASSFWCDYDLINPFAYELPISPHLAGQKNPVDFEKIKTCFTQLQILADIVIVEGAGGFFTPLNQTQTIADLAKTLNLPVIMTVGIKLGCINHALLTYQAIKKMGLEFAGWFAVCNDSMVLFPNEIIDFIEEKIAEPLLHIFPYAETILDCKDQSR